MTRRPVAPLVSPAFHLGLMAVGLVACVAADVRHAGGPAAVLLLSLSAAFAWRVPLRTLVRPLLPLLSCGLIAAALLLAAPVAPSAPVWTPPGWGRPVAAASAAFLLALWVKSGLVVLWFAVLGHGLTGRDLLEGLIALRLPHRVTVLVYLMVSGLAAARDDIRRLMRARAARGRPHGLYALRVAAAMSGTLLVRLGRRAETQALALASRGFRGSLALLDVRPLQPAHALTLIVTTGVLLWLARL